MSRSNKRAACLAVVYARVARDTQGALDAQVQRVLSRARRHGWDDVGVVAEVVGCGVSDAGLQRLCAADIVFIDDLSRLGRGTGPVVEAWTALATAGVSVVVGEGLGGGPDPTVMTLMATMATLMGSAQGADGQRTRRGIAAAMTRRQAQR